MPFIVLMLIDPPHSEDLRIADESLTYGADLVKHIRQEFGDSFTICVAGKNHVSLLCNNGNGIDLLISIDSNFDYCLITSIYIK